MLQAVGGVIDASDGLWALRLCGAPLPFSLQSTLHSFAMFAAGVLFGTTGIKVLGSKDTKKAYAHTTAAVFRAKDSVTDVKVYDRTGDAVVLYTADRGSVIAALAAFSFPKAEALDLVPEHTSRALNQEFEDKLAMTVMRRIFRQTVRAPAVIPWAVRNCC